MQSSSRLLNSGFGLSYCLLPKENILWASKEMKGIRLDLQAWVLQHLKGALSDWSVFLLPHYPHHTFMCFPTHLACCAIVFQNVFSLEQQSVRETQRILIVSIPRTSHASVGIFFLSSCCPYWPEFLTYFLCCIRKSEEKKQATFETGKQIFPSMPTAAIYQQTQ